MQRVPKETSHRGDELKGLGWSEAEVVRYVELWEYRQRWGAMNLEREDRLFLRKAENALPKILSGRAAAKKSLKDKSYYSWLRFQCDAMAAAEAEMGLSDGEKGAWPVLLETELRILDLPRNRLGAVPEYLGGVRSLPQLWLYDCGLTELPASLGKLHRLQKLELGDSGLQLLRALCGVGPSNGSGSGGCTGRLGR